MRFGYPVKMLTIMANGIIQVIQKYQHQSLLCMAKKALTCLELRTKEKGVLRFHVLVEGERSRFNYEQNESTEVDNTLSPKKVISSDG